MAARNVRARRTGKPWFAARLCWLLGVGVGLPGGSGGAVLLGGHRPGHLEHALGELPLAGEQLLGEVVGTGHELLGLGQLVSEGQAGRRDRRRDRLDRLGPGLDGIDDGVLALANGVQDLALNLVADGAGIGHFFLLGGVILTLAILRALVDLSSAPGPPGGGGAGGGAPPGVVAAGGGLVPRVSRGCSRRARRPAPGDGGFPWAVASSALRPACGPTRSSPPTRS